MKTLTRKSSYIKIISLSLVIILLIIGASFAWFSTTYQSEQGMKYTTSDGTFVQMHAWMFNVNNEESGEATDKTGTWVSAINPNQSDVVIQIDNAEEGYQINRVVENESGAREKYTFKSLHLGTIDNLLTTSDDNYFYLRFDVTTPITQGRMVYVQYHIDVNDFHFYAPGDGVTDPTEKTDEVKAKLLAAGKSDLFSEMIKVECVSSETAYSPVASSSNIASIFEVKYLISNGNNYLGYQVSNGNVTIVNTTNPANAIQWTYVGGKLQCSINDTTYYLVSDNSALSLSTTIPSLMWQVNGNKLSYVHESTTYYVVYNSSWQVSSTSDDTLFDVDEYILLENGAEMASVFDEPKDTTYYVYVRFSPELDKCTEATDYLGEFMPCEILFDLLLAIEFRFYEGD